MNFSKPCWLMISNWKLLDKLSVERKMMKKNKRKMM